MKFLLLLCLLPLNLFSEELKVLTWNTFLLPPPWNISKQIQRTEAMKEILPSFDQDVMFFQEAFFDKERNQLIQELKTTHPFIAVPKKGHKLKQIQDSGLFITSIYPLKIIDQVIFNDCAKADCFSSKSAILVEVTLSSGKRVQMLDTHLQAWDGKKIQVIRRKQLEQIKKMMSKYREPNIPQFLVGDLNMDGNSGTEYKNSLLFMNMTSTSLDGPIQITNGFSTKGCFKNPGGGMEWIDHAWLKKNGSDAQITSLKVFPIFGQIDEKICPLSDHYALAATIRI